MSYISCGLVCIGVGAAMQLVEGAVHINQINDSEFTMVAS